MTAHRLEYLEVLDHVHRLLAPRVYIEVGVRNGESAHLALPGCKVIGIDPGVRLLWPLNSDSSVLRTTSDRAFESGAVDRALAGQPVDLAFIDGMHLFEFALRDFLNVECRSKREGVVLIHDCLPRNASEAQRARPAGAWSGDIWKVLACLQVERPDLGIAVISAKPTGLGVITNLSPESSRLDAPLGEVVERYVGLTFSFYESEVRPSLLTFPPSAEGVAEALGPRVVSTQNIEALVWQRDTRPLTPSVRINRVREWLRRSPAGPFLRLLLALLRGRHQTRYSPSEPPPSDRDQAEKVS